MINSKTLLYDVVWYNAFHLTFLHCYFPDVSIPLLILKKNQSLVKLYCQILLILWVESSVGISSEKLA